MQIAINKEGKKVHIINALSNEKYTCPCCGSEVVQRRGDVRIHHFAHISGCNCSDHWHYDMSEWHISWQNQFDFENQEVVFESNGEKHRADVFINNTVYEFQHSSMTYEEFEKRNRFYNKLGYKVIWVFDCIDQFDNDQISNLEGSNLKFRWKRSLKALSNYSVNKMVHVYLQESINSWTDDSEDGLLHRVCWVSESGIEYFASNKPISDKEFICNAKDIEYIEEDIDSNDSIYKKYSEILESSFYLFCPKAMKFWSSDECLFCDFFNTARMNCTYSEQNLMNTDTSKDQAVSDDAESNAINVNKALQEPTIVEEQKKNIAHSIPYLWRTIGIEKCGIFYNVVSGIEVKIFNFEKNYNKYGQCYGYLKHKGGSYNDYESKTSQVYWFRKDEWILVWHK